MKKRSTYSKMLLKEALKSKEIFWDIRKEEIKELSERALLERLLNLGTLKQFKKLISDKSEFKKYYFPLIKSTRTNLSPKVINLVKLSLDKSAQRNSK